MLIFQSGKTKVSIPVDELFDKDVDFAEATGWDPKSPTRAIQVSNHTLTNIKWMLNHIELTGKPLHASELGKLCNLVGMYMPSKQRSVFNRILWHATTCLEFDFKPFIYPNDTKLDHKGED